MFRVNQSGDERMETDSVSALEEANPFLARLLKDYLPDDPVAKKAVTSLTEDVSDIEEALRKKMQDTMNAAALVLQHIEDTIKGAERSLPGAEETKLKALIDVLRAQNGKLQTDTLQDAVELRRLESDLADKEAQILTMHRKLAMIRDGAAQQAGGPTESVKKEMPRPSSSQHIIPSSDGDTAKLQAAVEARTREVEQRDKVIAGLERYVCIHEKNKCRSLAR